jgi:uncharacterized protein (TIGR00369 family)
VIVDTELLQASMGLCELLDMRVVSAAPAEVVLEMDWAESKCTTAGMLHGGALMALADSSGAVCAFLNLPEGAGTSTIESKTNFTGAVRDGVVTATSRPLHVGSTTIVVETEVRRADGKLAGKVTQTQAVLKR